MSIIFLVPLFSGIINLIIALFLLNASRNNRERIIFAFFCLSVSLWLFGTYAMLISKDEQSAIFFDRIAYSGVAFIAVFMYHFSLIFCKKNDKFFYCGSDMLWD